MTGHEASAIAFWVPRSSGLDAPGPRALFEHAPDGVVEVDTKGRRLRANAFPGEFRRSCRLRPGNPLRP